MLKNTKNRNESGFTIIEVLIVLAIAALILVVVLIAVPNLQRSQRNSARKNEASRILTAANNYVSNLNGNPLTASSSAETTAIISDSGTLQQYKALTPGSTNVLTANQVNVATGAITPGVPASDAVLIDQGATCDTTTPGKTNAASNSRQIVLIYTLEATSGFTVACIGS